VHAGGDEKLMINFILVIPCSMGSSEICDKYKKYGIHYIPNFTIILTQQVNITLVTAGIN